MITKVFKDIAGYTQYQISDSGQIRRTLKFGEVTYLKPFFKDNHLVVHLYDGACRKQHYLHRLVLTTFGPQQPADMPLALHLDDDPEHNAISNLCWGDKAMNAQMAVRNGKLCPHHLKTFLTPEEAASVRDQFATGTISMSQLAKEFGCSRWTISNIVHNRVERLRAGEVSK